jgi:hypothetical protein
MNECIDSTMGRIPRMLAVVLASDDPRTSWSFQHTHAHEEITPIPLSCGGDECDADSLSLLIQSYIQTCTYSCVCVYHDIFIYIYICLSVFLIRNDSWLSNSLFLLDTGGLIGTTISCRPCHPTFLLGFHRFSECVRFSWLFTECCALVKVLNVFVCVRMSVYDSCLT